MSPILAAAPVIYLPVALRMGLWVQVTAALLLTAWHVRRNGWLGVQGSTKRLVPALRLPTHENSPATPEPVATMRPTLPSPIPFEEPDEDDEEIYDNEPIFDDELTNHTDGKDQTHV